MLIINFSVFQTQKNKIKDQAEYILYDAALIFGRYLFYNLRIYLKYNLTFINVYHICNLSANSFNSKKKYYKSLNWLKIWKDKIIRKLSKIIINMFFFSNFS